MQIQAVNNSQTNKQFLECPLGIYSEDDIYVRPLDKDINFVFDESKNKFFKNGGEAQRWILKDNNDRVIGRVAAFHSPRFSFKHELPIGGMGFFECINDKKAAFLLFDTCKTWLEERGFKGMDGPINFGQRDRWWGLLVDGFLPPNYCMNYNPPYYQSLFEEYGFQVYFKQYTYGRDIYEVQDKFYEKSRHIRENPDFRFEHIDKKRLPKYAEDFRYIYNKAWAGTHESFKPMKKEQAMAMMNSLKPVLDEHIAIFGYHKEEPIAMYINIPDLNVYFKHLNGNLNWWGKLKFAWYRWRKPNSRAVGLIFGVIPDFQKMGCEGALITATYDIITSNKKNYNHVELNWIGDFNPKMMAVAKGLDADIIKTHHTYRMFFDPSVPFERYPIV